MVADAPHVYKRLAHCLHSAFRGVWYDPIHTCRAIVRMIPSCRLTFVSVGILAPHTPSSPHHLFTTPPPHPPSPLAVTPMPTPAPARTPFPTPVPFVAGNANDFINTSAAAPSVLRQHVSLFWPVATAAAAVLFGGFGFLGDGRAPAAPGF